MPGTERPWAQSEITKAIEREKEYFNSLLGNKFFKKNKNTIQRFPDEDWAIFPGDKVMVMVGKDKGKRGEVSHVIRDANAVFVDQLNTVRCSIIVTLFLFDDTKKLSQGFYLSL